jgi:hypothetical protein
MEDDEADETPKGVVMPGRHSDDRRIRVARPNSAYFRYEGPGTVRAKREAIAPVRRGEKLSTGLRQLVFGRALATDEEGEERLKKPACTQRRFVNPAPAARSLRSFSITAEAAIDAYHDHDHDLDQYLASCRPVRTGCRHLVAAVPK